MDSFETWESTLLLSIELLATLAFALTSLFRTLAILNNWVLPAWRKD